MAIERLPGGDRLSRIRTGKVAKQIGPLGGDTHPGSLLWRMAVAGILSTRFIPAFHGRFEILPMVYPDGDWLVCFDELGL